MITARPAQTMPARNVKLDTFYMIWHVIWKYKTVLKIVQDAFFKMELLCVTNALKDIV